MDFLNTLKINTIWINEEELFSFEEFLVEKIWRKFDFYFNNEENFLFIFNENFLNNEKVWFWEYIEAWKVTKEYLIERKLTDEQNYKKLYSIEKKEFSKEEKSVDELDNLIAEVPQNDTKLNEALDFLNKIKKKG
jgi:hypothetical protein